jgi:hypothetical protein
LDSKKEILMNTQTFTKPSMISNLFALLPQTDFQLSDAIQASPRDFGFDFDEDELARELLAPLPGVFADRTSP